mmetsp:Transcript_28925/g.43632  ORF Transcript_28925/g.43632 Transcript_28925/m.43632 type:complete len:86 (+) Transcript_28925:597-854(+)
MAFEIKGGGAPYTPNNNGNNNSQEEMSPPSRIRFFFQLCTTHNISQCHNISLSPSLTRAQQFLVEKEQNYEIRSRTIRINLCHHK